MIKNKILNFYQNHLILSKSQLSTLVKNKSLLIKFKINK